MRGWRRGGWHLGSRAHQARRCAWAGPTGRGRAGGWGLAAGKGQGVNWHLIPAQRTPHLLCLCKLVAHQRVSAARSLRRQEGPGAARRRRRAGEGWRHRRGFFWRRRFCRCCHQQAPSAPAAACATCTSSPLHPCGGRAAGTALSVKPHGRAARGPHASVHRAARLPAGRR